MNPWLWFGFGFAFCLALQFTLAIVWVAPYVRDSLRGT